MVPEKHLVIVAVGELVCKLINQQFVGHRGKAPLPNLSLLMNILDMELYKWASIIVVMPLCIIPREEKWVHLEDLMEKVVKDRDCMKGESPSVFKMFFMIPKEYFVVTAEPPEMNWPLISLKWVLGTLLLTSPQPPLYLLMMLEIFAIQVVLSFGEWSNCYLPLCHLPSRKAATNFLLCNSPWYF